MLPLPPRFLALALATSLIAACGDTPKVGSTQQEMGGFEGTFEYAIDAPWRMEPGPDGHGAIPINISIHDVMFDSMDNTLDWDPGPVPLPPTTPELHTITGFRGARFKRVTIEETLATNEVVSTTYRLEDLAEIESTRDCWAPSYPTLFGYATERLPCPAEPEHRICRDPGTCDTSFFGNIGLTSEWHASLWYQPHSNQLPPELEPGNLNDPTEVGLGSFNNPGNLGTLIGPTPNANANSNSNNSNKTSSQIVRLKVIVEVVGSNEFEDYWRVVTLTNHLRVTMAQDPLPRFGEGWLYGDLHYHSQGTDNEGESAYNYRSVARAMGAMGLDFVFATDHASDSEQIADVDIDIQALLGLISLGQANLIEIQRVVGGLLRDMNADRFTAYHGLINSGDGVNAEVGPFGEGSLPPQSVLSHGVVPQIYLGGEIDAIPEVEGPWVPFGNGRNFPISKLCSGWHDEAWLPSCDPDQLLEPSGDGVYLVRDVQGINDMDYGREHLIYLPRSNALYLNNQLAFVSSRTRKYGGAGRRLSEWHIGLPPLLPEIESKGFAFIAHPMNDGASEGPNGPPWSEHMLRQSWRSEAVLGLQLWNADAHMKTKIGSDDETGYERPEDLWQVIPTNGEREGFIDGAFELKPFDLKTGRWDEGIFGEWKRKEGAFLWDRMNMWGLDPSQTASLDWLPQGEPRRSFMSGGSDAHGDLNYHRSGYLLGTTGISDSAIGKPRNLVFAGQPSRYENGGGIYRQDQVVDALAAGNFSITDGPALRIVVDRTKNGFIDDAGEVGDETDAAGEFARPDIPMGGIGHFYDHETTIPVIVEWVSTEEFGKVKQIEWTIGVRCADGQERMIRSNSYIAPSLSGIATKEIRPASLACDSGDDVNPTAGTPITGFFVRAVARTKSEAPSWTCNYNNRFSLSARTGKCIQRVAYTNPVWMMAEANDEAFSCEPDHLAMDGNDNGLPDACERDEIVGVTYYPPWNATLTFRKSGIVQRGSLNNLDAENSHAYTLPPGKHSADIVGMAFCGKEAGVSTRLYTWYRDNTVSEGTAYDLGSIRAPYAFTASRPATEIAYITCAETSITGRFFTYYLDGNYSTGKANALAHYQSAQTFTLPIGHSASDIVGMLVPDDWWRTYTYFRGSAGNGDVGSGLYFNLGLYGIENYFYGVFMDPVGGGLVNPN